MAKLSLDVVIARVDELPLLPQIVMRVMELTEDPDATAFDINDVIN